MRLAKEHRAPRALRSGMVQAGLALLLGAAGLSCNDDQPAPFCTISRALYAARYVPDGQPTGMCAGYVPLKGEKLGGQAYLPDPMKAGDKYSLAIQSPVLGQRVVEGERANPKVLDPDPNHKPYSLGQFTADRPDGNNICSAPTLSDAEFNGGALLLPGNPTAMPPVPPETLPPIAVKYHWSDFKSLVSATNIGLVWGANLEHTLNGCTAKYSVVAIAPPVDCTGANGMADNSKCDVTPREAENFFGSGLNPDTAVTCDPDLLLCVPSGPFPSKK
jgi:hypothetical protein